MAEVGIFPEMWSKPDKTGELKKQGHMRKNWKSRWFILQNDYLFYFKSRLVSAVLDVRFAEIVTLGD